MLTTFPPNLTPEEAELWSSVPMFEIWLDTLEKKQTLLAMLQASLAIGG